MNTDRLTLLFPESRYASKSERERQKNVLTAVCLAVSARAKDSQYRMSLTSEVNGVSIDEVIKFLPTPVSIVVVIGTIRELVVEGYLNDNDARFEIIELTDLLFTVIAEEWVYLNGSRPFVIGEQKIYAQDRFGAEAIHQRRLILEQKGGRSK